MAPMTADVTTETMEASAHKALASLPSAFAEHCRDIVLQVQDFATSDQLASVGLVDRWELSGLYQGRPLPDQSLWDTGEMPPRVWLFRMPLLAEMRATGVGLDELVRHVVIHEIGHHFGFSDDDMHALEDQASNS